MNSMTFPTHVKFQAKFIRATNNKTLEILAPFNSSGE